MAMAMALAMAMAMALAMALAMAMAMAMAMALAMANTMTTYYQTIHPCHLSPEKLAGWWKAIRLLFVGGEHCLRVEWRMSAHRLIERENVQPLDLSILQRD